MRDGRMEEILEVLLPPPNNVPSRGQQPPTPTINSVGEALLPSPEVEEELWEEEFIEHCFQEMLDEEDQWEWFIPSRDLAPGSVGQLQEQIGLLVLDPDMHAEASDLEVVMRSSLNPNAKEFTPGIQKHNL
ncbi:hypothetical protein ATANTOWER_019026 [Ataeniobius toweri]|uniref:Polyadenylate-binding protein-interacting protein 2 n=1 Tax=Ataeniobius toweri TaxID=208326 RepID=A0ABU7C005_9TELE|nr:hypothetical protein [Ataeniobius toweri]